MSFKPHPYPLSPQAQHAAIDEVRGIPRDAYDATRDSHTRDRLIRADFRLADLQDANRSATKLNPVIEYEAIAAIRTFLLGVYLELRNSNVQSRAAEADYRLSKIQAAHRCAAWQQGIELASPRPLAEWFNCRAGGEPVTGSAEP